MVVLFRMIRFVLITVLLAACMAGASTHAQEEGTTVRPLKPTQETLSDPRLDMVGKLPARVVVHPASAMKQEDKDLAASAAPAIRQRAAFHDLGFAEGDWQQSEIDCPAFPEHLLLRFTRNRGAGDVTMFTASIPRGKDGRVRVIPIMRRGFSLISPAPMNKVTMAAFNQIRAEEHMGEKADWSAVSVCYAALSSARWNEPQADVTLEPVGSDILQLQTDGGVSVTLELATPAPGRWVVTYDRKGQLARTEYTAFGNEMWQPLPATLTEMKGKPLPATTDVQERPISGSAPIDKPLPPPSDSPAKPPQ